MIVLYWWLILIVGLDVIGRLATLGEWIPTTPRTKRWDAINLAIGLVTLLLMFRFWP